ncbi:V-type ATP synthase subunit I [Lacunimicrobium album]
MSIVVLDKVTFVGDLAKREELLESLQRLGIMHLTSLNHRNVKEAQDGMISDQTRLALKDLLACPVRRPASPSHADIRIVEVTREVLELKRLRNELNDERDYTVKSIRDLTPWGEFQTVPEKDLAGNSLWTYMIPHQQMRLLERVSLPYAIVNRGPEDVYVVVASPEEPDNMPGQRIELDPRPLSAIRSRLDEIDSILSELEWKRAELTKWITQLRMSIDVADDTAAREWARDLCATSEPLFAVQGWAPRVDRSDLIRIASDLGMAVSFHSPVHGENVPTLLKNPDVIAGAEGAVTFYTTPAYETWDPTRVVFYSFSLFYGMIIADAGYGAVMALALALGWTRLGKSNSGARLRYLLLAITTVSIIFGMLVGSYFGMTPSSGSWLKRWQILDFANRSQMMFLSLVIGIAHLSLANMIATWNARGSLIALSSLGWLLVLWGGFLVAIGSSESLNTRITGGFGKVLLLSGLLCVLCFSSMRPLQGWRNCLGRIGDGLSALTNVTKLFGDVLSYLRLFALGLASAQLAATFNQLAFDMSHVRGIGLLLAILILVGGHSINLVLGLMGGVVHGLRLNCIEFFNWSLTESGSPFRSFRKKATL